MTGIKNHKFNLFRDLDKIPEPHGRAMNNPVPKALRPDREVARPGEFEQDGKADRGQNRDIGKPPFF